MYSSSTHKIVILNKTEVCMIEILLTKYRDNSCNLKGTLESKQISQQKRPGGKCKNHIKVFQILLENKVPEV